MKIAMGQFAARPDWRENLEICGKLMAQAVDGGAQLLVLPEGIHARFPGAVPTVTQYLDADQPIGGPFVNGILERSEGLGLTTVVGVKGSVEGQKRNTLAIVRDGRLVTSYDKIHVMDALGGRESDQIVASSNAPVTFELDGHTIGVMTCYDVRFPELARLLALAGAEVIALPAAWVAGHQKERHWEVLVAARALENTVYVAGSGECGPTNVGLSMFVDPMGVVVSKLGHTEGIVFGDADFEYLAQVREQLPVLKNRRFSIDPTVLENPRDYERDPMPGIEALIAAGRVRPNDVARTTT